MQSYWFYDPFFRNRLLKQLKQKRFLIFLLVCYVCWTLWPCFWTAQKLFVDGSVIDVFPSTCSFRYHFSTSSQDRGKDGRRKLRRIEWCRDESPICCTSTPIDETCGCTTNNSGAKLLPSLKRATSPPITTRNLINCEAKIRAQHLPDLPTLAGEVGTLFEQQDIGRRNLPNHQMDPWTSNTATTTTHGSYNNPVKKYRTQHLLRKIGMGLLLTNAVTMIGAPLNMFASTRSYVLHPAKLGENVVAGFISPLMTALARVVQPAAIATLAFHLSAHFLTDHINALYLGLSIMVGVAANPRDIIAQVCRYHLQEPFVQTARTPNAGCFDRNGVDKLRRSSPCAAIRKHLSAHAQVHTMLLGLCLPRTVLVCIIGPWIEEAEFRFLLQTVIMREIPRTILRCWSSSRLVDHWSVSSLRLLIASALFAVGHHECYDSCLVQKNVKYRIRQNRVITAFLQGLIWGLLAELEDTRTLLPFVVHALFNLQQNILLQCLVQFKKHRRERQQQSQYRGAAAA